MKQHAFILWTKSMGPANKALSLNNFWGKCKDIYPI